MNNQKPDIKKCMGCGIEKPFTSKYFPIHKRNIWGLETRCRKCTCAKAKVVNFEERKRLRHEVLSVYGKDGVASCVCCGESNIEFLTLDHIEGGGREDRKKYPATMLPRRLRRLGYPLGYRTLCWNCNCSLGMYGYCPHQLNKSDCDRRL